MKISNETKIGTLTAVSITLLILGFNFLKGKNVFKKKATMYVTFTKVEGLNIADAIKINGLRVGGVEAIDELDADLTRVLVSFHLTREINIPVDSYGKIVATPLGSTSVVVTLGNSKTYLKDGDTLKGIDSRTMVEEIKTTLEPTIAKINTTLSGLDSTIRKVGNILDEQAKKDIAKMLNDLAMITGQINGMLTPGQGSLAKSMENINSFTLNLKNNNDSINSIVKNLAKTSGNLASADIINTVNSLEKATQNLNQILTDIKSGKGNLGKLANDEQLYKNLNGTANSLNVLLQDLKQNPKRYVHFSLFGKKDKTEPVKNMIVDSLPK